MMKPILLVFLTLTANLRSFADTATATQTTPQDLADRVINDVSRGHSSWVKDEAPVDIPILEKGTIDFPTDPQIYYALALCYGQQDDKQDLLKNMEKAYTLSHKDLAIGMVYAVSLKMNKQPSKAFEVDKELLALHPNNFGLQFSLATLEILIQKYDEAIAILEPFAQNPPPNLTATDRAIILYNLGTCYLYKGNHAKAIDTLESAIAQMPSLTLAFSALGEAYLKSGNIEKASAALDKSLEKSPNWPPTLYYKGIILEKTGDIRTAQENFQKAYAILKKHLDENGQNGEDYYLMFLICQKLSKGEEGDKCKAEAAQLLFTYEAPWKQN